MQVSIVIHCFAVLLISQIMFEVIAQTNDMCTIASVVIASAVVWQVYIEPHTRADLQFITQAMYPQLPADMLADMIAFNQKVTCFKNRQCHPANVTILLSL